jgi:hypothetical protein
MLAQSYLNWVDRVYEFLFPAVSPFWAVSVSPPHVPITACASHTGSGDGHCALPRVSPHPTRGNLP